MQINEQVKLIIAAIKCNSMLQRNANLIANEYKNFFNWFTKMM